MTYKKIAYWVVICLLLVSINNLIHSIFSTWQKQDLINQAQQNLAAEKEENQKLKKDIAQVNKPQFIESEARDKLLLAKPGEGIVIMPKTQLATPSSPAQHTVDKRSNWQKWWNLFFQSS